MASRAARYEGSPTLKRDETSGKMGVTKAEATSARVNDGTEGIPIHARHAIERQAMTSRQEMDHAMADYGSGGDKAEMLARHQQEMKDMHKRHMKEAGKGAEAEPEGKSKAKPDTAEKTESKDKTEASDDTEE